MPWCEVHDTSTTNSSVQIWGLQIFALFNFPPMKVMSGYCISNPERYANYMITLCKCDRDRYDFAESTDYSSTHYWGTLTVAFLKWQFNYRH